LATKRAASPHHIVPASIRDETDTMTISSTDEPERVEADDNNNSFDEDDGDTNYEEDVEHKWLVINSLFTFVLLHFYFTQVKSLHHIIWCRWNDCNANV
jgi:hypothetical protein